MDSKLQPLVSIVTPVYNNADYLPECIESILAQTYQNWDYTIVNNCSSDGSGDIARGYAAKDARIKVLDNNQFLPVIPNHNHALQQISPASKYCKIVFADDWIFPTCIEDMVGVIQEHPSVGIVGAYGLEEIVHGRHEHVVVWGGLPYPSRIVSGREVCRRLFLEGTYVFGTSTSVLYRSDLVRSHVPFYNEANLHADKETCVVLLKECDFGFLHQVLTFKRGRPGSLGMMSLGMQTFFGDKVHTLVTHGPDFLTEQELEGCLDDLLVEYYNFLAVSLLRGRRDDTFWSFHRKQLNQTVGFSRSRLAWAVLARLVKSLLNPYETFEKLRLHLRRADIQV